MAFKAAIFDMDGTMIDSLIFWDVLWSRMGSLYLHDSTFSPSKEDDKAVRTLTMRDAMELIHRNYGIGETGEEVFLFASQMLRDFYAEEVQLKPGVLEFLAYCRDKGIRMCVASASAQDLVSVAMEHCGLKPYFEKVFSCADLGVGKDKPDIYIQARNYLGSENAETCVFEDSLTAVETASSLGMQTVAIYDRFNYGQEQMKEIATTYIGPGETLVRLIHDFV